MATDATRPFLTRRMFLHALSQRLEGQGHGTKVRLHNQANELFDAIELHMHGLSPKGEHIFTYTVGGTVHEVRYTRQVGGDTAPMVERGYLDQLTPMNGVHAPETLPPANEHEHLNLPKNRKELGNEWVTHRDLVPKMAAYLIKHTGIDAGKTYAVDATIKTLRDFKTPTAEMHGIRCHRYYSGVRQISVAIHADDVEKFCAFAYSQMRPLSGIKNASELDRHESARERSRC